MIKFINSTINKIIFKECCMCLTNFKPFPTEGVLQDSDTILIKQLGSNQIFTINWSKFKNYFLQGLSDYTTDSKIELITKDSTTGNGTITYADPVNGILNVVTNSDGEVIGGFNVLPEATFVTGNVIIQGTFQLPLSQVDPPGVSGGSIYFNDLTNKFRKFDGTTWTDLN